MKEYEAARYSFLRDACNVFRRTVLRSRGLVVVEDVGRGGWSEEMTLEYLGRLGPPSGGEHERERGQPRIVDAVGIPRHERKQVLSGFLRWFYATAVERGLVNAEVAEVTEQDIESVAGDVSGRW